MRVVALVLFLLTGLGVHAKTSLDVITFNSPPYVDETMPAGRNGLEIEILRKALGKKFDLDFKFFPYARANAMFRVPEQNNHPLYLGTSVHFDDLIAAGKMQAWKIGSARFLAYARPENAISKEPKLNLDVLKKYRVGILRGSSINGALKSAGIEPVETRSIEQFFTVIDEGRVDCSILTELTGNEGLHENQKTSKHKIVSLKTPILVIPLSVVADSGNPNFAEIKAELDHRLPEMRKDGSLRALAAKYFGNEAVPEDFFSPEK